MDEWGNAPGLPDEAFEHDGLITKRHARASAFAFLRPGPGQLLWDVGTGSGAMAIEWTRAAAGARAIGLERDPARAARARSNADRLSPGPVVGCAMGECCIEIRVGEASELLGDLPTPDAVFVGGGATSGVLDACWEALRPGGRLVAHGVTFETERELVRLFEAYGGSLSRLDVAHAEPIGRFLAWTPLRPIVQWAATKPAS